jgi:glycosidase
VAARANYHGGDLQGILEKLEEGYFERLGVNALWLSPVIENTDRAHQEYPPPHRFYTGYHGYWPTHPRRVEERFGDMELLQRLVREARAGGSGCSSTSSPTTPTRTTRTSRSTRSGSGRWSCRTGS